MRATRASAAGAGARWLSCSSGRRCFFYGEAAVGYLGDARRPGRPGRLATWGVRLGWLAQTALLGVQAARDDGFPWGTWASSLDLFVWLVVSAYLIWGCRGAVPAARSCRDAARRRAARRRARGRRDGSREREPLLEPLPRPPRRSRPRGVRGLHARCGAFGALRLAGAAAEDRPATILRRQVPALATLDSLALRTVAWSVPLLTLGIAVGLVRLVARGDRRWTRSSPRRP